MMPHQPVADLSNWLARCSPLSFPNSRRSSSRCLTPIAPTSLSTANGCLRARLLELARFLKVQGDARGQGSGIASSLADLTVAPHESLRGGLHSSESDRLSAVTLSALRGASVSAGGERAATKKVAVASALLDHRAFATDRADIGLANQIRLQEVRQRSSLVQAGNVLQPRKSPLRPVFLIIVPLRQTADIGLINQATLCVVHIDGVIFHELS